MALLWAAICAPAYAAYAVWRMRVVVTVIRDGVIVPLHWWVVAARGALLGAWSGAAMGVLFALLLVAVARRRSALPLSMRMTAACGAAAVAAVSAVAEARLAYTWAWLRPIALLVPGGALTAAALGAALAAGTLALARRSRGERLTPGSTPMLPTNVPRIG